TRVETRLCAVLLFLEFSLLCFWVALKGLAREFTQKGNSSGLVLRLMLTAAAIGAIANLVKRIQKARATGAQPRWGREALIGAGTLFVVFVGLSSWSRASIEWSSNFLNWTQNASILMLFGGLRGVVTRLTLWLALLGASIATSKGKHINVDVVVRAIKPKARV